MIIIIIIALYSQRKTILTKRRSSWSALQVY